MTDKQKNKMLKVDNRLITTLGINPSILLSELIDKEQFCIEENQIDKEGYFFHEKNHIFKRTALKRNKFDTARSILEWIKILKTKIGAGKKLYFKIDDVEYSRFIFPKAQQILPRSTIHEELTKEWYFMYNLWLAHEIGINETIFLTDLISKRNYFSTRWELINGFFFNSISSVQKTTSLGRKQQDRCIKNLIEHNLIFTKLIDGNTRYFCLNDNKIDEFKWKNYVEFKNSESWKGTTSESWKGTGIDLPDNPFWISESWFGTGSESWKQTAHESGKVTPLKVEKEQERKLESDNLESWNSTPNNNKTNTTNKQVLNNKNKEQQKLLACYFDISIPHERNKYNEICKKYSASRINEVLKNLPDKKNLKWDSFSWFIIWALENNKFTIFRPKEKTHEEIQNEYNKKLSDDKKSKETLEKKKFILEWKEKNTELHEELQEKFKQNIIDEHWDIFEIKLRSAVSLKIKEYILENFYNNKTS